MKNRISFHSEKNEPSHQYLYKYERDQHVNLHLTDKKTWKDSTFFVITVSLVLNTFFFPTVLLFFSRIAMADIRST
jgi:hypothetical protein